MKISWLFGVVLALLTYAQPAVAQYNGGYTINTPGQMPTFVNPSGNGGYIVNTPGQMPSIVNPNYTGGYTVVTPRQMPTFINPATPSYPQPLGSGNQVWHGFGSNSNDDN